MKLQTILLIDSIVSACVRIVAGSQRVSRLQKLRESGRVKVGPFNKAFDNAQQDVLQGLSSLGVDPETGTLKPESPLLKTATAMGDDVTKAVTVLQERIAKPDVLSLDLDTVSQDLLDAITPLFKGDADAEEIAAEVGLLRQSLRDKVALFKKNDFVDADIVEA